MPRNDITYFDNEPLPIELFRGRIAPEIRAEQKAQQDFDNDDPVARDFQHYNREDVGGMSERDWDRVKV